MSAWISNGDSGSSVRGKLNDIPVLARGVIASPTALITASIPSDVYSVIITLEGLTGSKIGDDTLSVALGLQVSYDNGSTFIGDSDAYFTQGGDILTSGFSTYGGYSSDVAVDLATWGPTPSGGDQAFVGYSGRLHLYPGDGTMAMNITGLANSLRPNKAGYMPIINGTMNQSSSSPSVASFKDRITDICIQYYNSVWGDSTINGGYYCIQGLK